MTKTAELQVPGPAPAAVREPRPFLFLSPVAAAPKLPQLDPVGLRLLAEQVEPHVPFLVRSLVDHTIALQNRRSFERGQPQALQMSVLNRRRRSARAWLLAIGGGQIDAATTHALVSQWVPTLAGSGGEPAASVAVGRSCLEFVRGAITALLFDAPAANLLPAARALHVLETVLGVHLAAMQAAGRRALG